jgi:hypothetical protein
MTKQEKTKPTETGSARSWTINWTQRNGMERTGFASSDLRLVGLLVDIIELSEPRKITFTPNPN